MQDVAEIMALYLEFAFNKLNLKKQNVIAKV
jgi:hypothetical protein